MKLVRPWAMWLIAGVAVLGSNESMSQPKAPEYAPGALPTHPDRAIILDVTRAGPQLVAVGERGVVWLSGDSGRSWGARRTPTTRTLTTVVFAGEKLGVAVGHGGTILRTVDGGANWTQIFVPEAGSDSLIGATWLGGEIFVAYGGFGLYLVSRDSGQTWQRRKILEPDFDRHVSRVTSVGHRYLLAGESSALAFSDDAVEWKRVPSPYKGSWFGAMSTSGGSILLYGMRGHVFRSENNGIAWKASDFRDERSVMGGCQLDDGRIVLVGIAGLVQISNDDGRTFVPVEVSARGDIAQVLGVGGDQLVMVGDRGISHATLNSAAARLPEPDRKAASK